jgi:predicted glycosyltransferase
VFNGKVIFYGALDWGLGHATRSVPIIKELLKNNTVILGITPLTKPVFDEEFPGLKQIELPAYRVRYSTIWPLWVKLGWSAPRITRIITKENEQLKKIIEENKIDVVISDNRFGLYSDKIHSVFITHQLFLKAPVFEGWSNSVNQNYILKFNEVWVPDFENDTSLSEVKTLSGELSHGKHFHKNVKYIGPKSRLNDVISPIEKDKYDLLILLSGPEPTRTELEKKLLEKFKDSSKKVVLVRGSDPDSYRDGVRSSESIEIFNLPGKEKLKELILSSRKIICRSGYSTLMDMHALSKKDLILIPTPGQTEQEYLAEHWKERFGATLVKQNEINKLINFVS